MKPLSVKLSIAFFLLSISAYSQAATIRAVIGTQTSQVIESLKAGQPPSLSVLPDSILPLTPKFTSITQIQPSYVTQWSSYLGDQIKVISKFRALSFNGELTHLDSSSGFFTIQTKNKNLTLPISDFYLSTNNESSPKQASTHYPNAISYQSNDISWLPQKTFIFSGNNVKVINLANIKNVSDSPISLESSLLHYSPPNLMRTQSAFKMSDSKTISPQYIDDEITYPISKLSLAAHSNTLIPLTQFTSSLDKSLNKAVINTGFRSNGDIPIKFGRTLFFTLSEDAMPGQYQTYWQRDDLLIPSNYVYIDSARAKQSIQVETNKSLTITGQLTLISSSSQKLPTRQVWELTLTNHSKENQDYQITQNLPSVINSVSGINITKGSANSVLLKGTLSQGKTMKQTYAISLKE